MPWSRCSIPETQTRDRGVHLPIIPPATPDPLPVIDDKASTPVSATKSFSPDAHWPRQHHFVTLGFTLNDN